MCSDFRDVTHTFREEQQAHQVRAVLRQSIHTQENYPLRTKFMGNFSSTIGDCQIQNIIIFRSRSSDSDLEAEIPKEIESEDYFFSL